MEAQQHRVGDAPRPRPQQPARDGQIEEGAAPAQGIGQPTVPQPRSRERPIAVGGEPDAQRQRAQEPVAVQFRHAGKQVDQGQLGPQRPEHPGRQGSGTQGRLAPRIQGRYAVQGHEHHEQADQAQPVIVIEIEGLVQELDVRKAREEQNDADAIAPAEGNQDAEDAERPEMRIHAPLRPGLEPGEPQIGEVVFRLNIQFRDPAADEKTDDARQAHETEKDAKGRA